MSDLVEPDASEPPEVAPAGPPAGRAEAATEPRRRFDAFTLRKLHSATGVAPVGVFFVMHLWTQASAHEGRSAYDAAMDRALSVPLQPVLELLLVMLPLLFHASYGVVLALRSRSTVAAYPTSRNWMYTAQRATGITTLLFLLWHVSATWLPRVSGKVRPSQVYPHLVESLSATSAGLPVAALAMMVGVAAASFHFANGLWGAGVSWGLLRTRRAQVVGAGAAVLLGVALFLGGTDLTARFSAGGRVLPALGETAPGAPEDACEATPTRRAASSSKASRPGATP